MNGTFTVVGESVELGSDDMVFETWAIRGRFAVTLD